MSDLPLILVTLIAALCAGACGTTSVAPDGGAATRGQGVDDRAFKHGAGISLEGAETEHRLALVIGNGDYADAPLRNPVNDARLVAATLRDLRFEVIEHTNADRYQMQKAIVEFGRRLRESGGVGLFYFAGHGMQIGGKNYLIPMGATIEAEEDVPVESVEIDAVLAKMDGAHSRLNIVILDACRNNPYARSFRSSAGGLAFTDAPTGTLIAYATAPGSVASDGSGDNGAYTEALVKAMKLDDVELGQMFRRVRTDVKMGTEGKQVPWESSSLEGEFYFGDKASAAATPCGAGTVWDQATRVCVAAALPQAAEPDQHPAWVLEGSGFIGEGSTARIVGVGAATGVGDSANTAADMGARDDVRQVVAAWMTSAIADAGAANMSPSPDQDACGLTIVKPKVSSDDTQRLQALVLKVPGEVAANARVTEHWADTSGTTYSRAELDPEVVMDRVRQDKTLTSELRAGFLEALGRKLLKTR